MAPGEIYLAKFPYGGSPGMKLRPVLLLTGPVGTVPEVLVAYISSVLPTTPLPSDVLLDPTQPEYAGTPQQRHGHAAKGRAKEGCKGGGGSGHDGGQERSGLDDELFQGTDGYFHNVSP